MTAVEERGERKKRVSADAPRPAPYSQEAERALIGAMLLTKDARTTAFEYPVLAVDFWRGKLGQIFRAIEGLHAAGSAIDVLTVTEALRRDVEWREAPERTKRELFDLQGEGLSHNAATYCETIAELATFRRTIEFCGELGEAAYDLDPERCVELLRGGLDRVFAHYDSAPKLEAAKDVLDISIEQAKVRNYVVPELFVPGDRLIVTGGEGTGKTTWLRQFATQCAAGVHPFTLDDMSPVRVVHFDLQDSDDQSDLEYAWLLGKDRARERISRGALRLVHRRQGFDVLNPADRRWFVQSIEGAQIAIVGPLYKSFRAPKGESKHAPAVAEEVTAVFDEIVTETGVVLMFEAHAPHGTSNDRANYRPEGPAQWLRWPEFGFGMVHMRVRDGETKPRGVNLRRFRGDRPSGREWPSSLFYGTGDQWPWLAPREEVL